jgi:DNA polymerase-3 subunit gamma/tau
LADCNKTREFGEVGKLIVLAGFVVRYNAWMSYQVLARKYRPRLFSEMVGQEHVLRALINALDQDRLHHAYLFTGTRGVGKTTIARILAKCLNCESGVSSTPCGECSSCLEVAEGRSVDLIEVDAASRTRVEDTRELLDNVQYMPSKSRFKVYLIDEVHMLSNHSFNALLKTLEEPPPHVKFLLATTDPKKLPVTVLSRCLQFNLSMMSPERIVDYLRVVLAAEAVEADDPALWLLGRAADGSMRDALSLTDQAIAYGQNALREAEVKDMLGTLDRAEVYGLLGAVADNDPSTLLAKVRALAEFAPDYEALLREVLSVLHQISVAQMVPGAVDNSQGDQDQVLVFAERLTPEDVQLYYQIGVNGQRDLPFSPDLRGGFEMTMLRMLAFRVAGIVRDPGDPPRGPSGRESPGPKTSGSEASSPEASSPEASSPEAGSGASSPARAALDALKSAAQAPGPRGGESPRTPSLRGQAPLLESSGRGTPPPRGATRGDDDVDAGKLDDGKVETGKIDQRSVGTSPNRVVAEPAFNDYRVHDRPEDPRGGPSVRVASGPERGHDAISEPTLMPVTRDSPAKSGLAKSGGGNRPDRSGIGLSIASEVVPVDPGIASSVSATPSFSTEQWLTDFEELRLSGVTRTLAANCVAESAQSNGLQLVLNPSHATLLNEGHRRKIQEALRVLVGRDMTVKIEIRETPTSSPASVRREADRRAQACAVQAIESDDRIRAIVESFDGRVIAGSIAPNLGGGR